METKTSRKPILIESNHTPEILNGFLRHASETLQRKDATYALYSPNADVISFQLFLPFEIAKSSARSLLRTSTFLTFNIY